ncbi:ATP-binding cassette domain-containing protein [Limibacter armeniacum]|uniref:cell division ATP-binding protein FtsE n=1 Tax=Limibacter armeniacum TaxID=466084 RepID=UPI002FE61421
MKNIVVSFRDVDIEQEDNVVMKGINIDVAEGEFLYLIGKTGSGKSSILKTMYADLEPKSGTVKVVGYNVRTIKRKEIAQLRRKLGIVFQDFELLTDRTVKDNLIFVMEATGWKSAGAMERKVYELLERVGLEGSGNKYPHQLSGGEQQRLTIARALVNDPLVLLADEPTGNLDPAVAQDILKLFVEINQQGTAVIMATHYHSFLKQYPARVIYCEDGNLKDLTRNQILQRLNIGESGD